MKSIDDFTQKELRDMVKKRREELFPKGDKRFDRLGLDIEMNERIEKVKNEINS